MVSYVIFVIVDKYTLLDSGSQKTNISLQVYYFDQYEVPTSLIEANTVMAINCSCLNKAKVVRLQSEMRCLPKTAKLLLDA